MNSDRAIESWSYLWRENKDDCVLLKVDGDDLTSTDGCLIYNKSEHSRLLIEDDDIAEAIMTRMKAAGVPIVFRKDLPPGKNELERIIDEMLESGKSGSEINAAIKEYERQREEGNQ